MSDYTRKTPVPDDEETQAAALAAREAATRQSEAQERARLAKARHFAQSPEGRALMAEAFDRVRGRALKDEDAAKGTA